MNKKLITIPIILTLALSSACSKISTQPNTQSPITATALNFKTNSITNLQYYFSKEEGHPDRQLINVINSSKSTLDIAIYSITKKDIVDSIISAKKKGIKVRIVTDKTESSTKSEKSELALIKKAGIPIKINSHSGLMHEKITIADNKVCTTGSYNYSDAATNTNDEVLVVINDSKVANDFDKEFTRMWNDTKGFKSY